MSKKPSTGPSPDRVAAAGDAAPEVVLVVVPPVHLEGDDVALLRVDDEPAHDVVAVLLLWGPYIYDVTH